MKQSLQEHVYKTVLPLWIRFMKPFLQGIFEKPFIRPSGVAILPIDPEMGLSVERASSNTLYEYFQTAALD